MLPLYLPCHTGYILNLGLSFQCLLTYPMNAFRPFHVISVLFWIYSTIHHLFTWLSILVPQWCYVSRVALLLCCVCTRARAHTTHTQFFTCWWLWLPPAYKQLYSKVDKARARPKSETWCLYLQCCTLHHVIC
jgi:hypothetical protein